MQSYVFRMGDNPNNLPLASSVRGYPIWGEEMKKIKRDDLQEINVERDKEIIKKIPRDKIGNPSTKPPLGFETWEEYWDEINRPERY